MLPTVIDLIQWAAIVGVAAYLRAKTTTLRRHIHHLEEVSRWRDVVEGGFDPRDYDGWHAFVSACYRHGAGLDVVHLYADRGSLPRPLPMEPAKEDAG